MSSQNRTFIVHPALGGLNTAADPTTLDPNELLAAENIEYLEGAQRKKRLGTAAFNSVSLISTATNVRAVADFWRYGASLVPTQNIVTVAGASVFRSTGDGTFTALTGSSSFGSNTSLTTNIILAGDFAVFADGSSVPTAYDQTTFGVMGSTGLAGSTGLLTAPPVFTAGSYHLRRIFYVGLSTSPSRTQYTAAGNIMDSTGGDTGSFMVNEGDGDALLGISQTFHKRLYFFKGSQHGSVHELSGATPTAFSMDKITDGAPVSNHRSIVTTGNDIYWLSRFGIHSLATTRKYGDTEQAFLSLPIQRTFRNELSPNRFDQSWGFWNPRRNIVGWFVVPSGNTTNLWVLVYNYALSDPAPGGKKFWSIWTFTAHAGVSGAVMLTPAGSTIGQPRLYLGSERGVLFAGDQTVLSDNAVTAYTARVKTPILTRFSEDAQETREKSFMGVTTFFNPKGNYSANLSITVDRRLQSQTVNLQGGGAVFDTDVFDTGVFGGADFNYTENIIEDRGRSILLDWTQGGANQDMELFGYAIRYFPAEVEPKEAV